MDAQDVIEETKSRLEACKTLTDCVDIAVSVFSIPYCSDIHKSVWPHFKARRDELGNVEGRKFLVVDVSAVHFAYYATDPITCVDATKAKISKLSNEFEADVTICAVDSPDLERKKLYPGYKAGRDEDKKDTAFIETRRKLEETLPKVFRHEGWESDDVMASVAFRCKLLGHYCTIVTDDKDLWQCLGNKTTIYAPRAKEFRDENWLLANHKISPKQVVDWLCMTGKDDVPACPGIGPKTASELLAKYSSFWDIYAAKSTFTEKRRAAIEGFAKEDYWIAHDLHKLRIDLCGFH